MSEFKVHNISLGLPGVENKAIAPKKDVKKKIVNNPKSLKFALAGLSVLGMAAAAGIMIYRGKLNTEDLNNLASKTKDKVAQQAGQTVQAFQKSEPPQVVSSEKLQEIVSDGATTAVLKQDGGKLWNCFQSLQMNLTIYWQRRTASPRQDLKSLQN